MPTALRARLAICLLLMAVSSKITLLYAQSFQHSYAVVVGISNYSSAQRWKHLPYARPDAEALAQRLKSEDYQVAELYDRAATKHNILAAFDSLGDKLGANDRVVVFISTHGTSKRIGADMRGYIVPYDGADFPSYISDAELKDASAEMQTARHQLFIIDACYGGLMITRSSGVPPDTPNYIGEVTSRIVREVISAGGGDQEVLDSGPNGHSVFANALLQGLAGAADLNRDGYITFPELQSYITPLASNAYQTPATGVFPGHQSGEYVFTSPMGRTWPAVAGPALPKIVVKKGDSDQLAAAKNLLNASRFSEALPLFRNAASAGNPDAMYYLGEAYFYGWGVPQDYKQAAAWYGNAAKAGNESAMASLGNEYLSGMGVEKNYQQALAWSRKAADAGNALGMADLGWIYEKGLGVDQDYKQAVHWYRKAAEAGNKDGMHNLGVMYDKGIGVDKDYAQAVTWYRKAAEAGDAGGMSGLGYAYSIGQGVTQDYQQAAAWYRKAAEAGDSTGMHNMGVMYENGIGVDKDYAQAVAWYRKAADAGNVGGMSGLGYAYLNGQGVAQDYRQAIAWNRKAAEAGDPTGMNNLGVMYENGYGVEKDYEQAVSWYRKAAAMGDSTGMKCLGVMYENGKGVDKDDGQAVAWYRKAAEAGDATGTAYLAHMYENGKGVKRDYPQAVNLYRKAALGGDQYAQDALKRLGESPQ